MCSNFYRNKNQIKYKYNCVQPNAAAAVACQNTWCELTYIRDMSHHSSVLSVIRPWPANINIYNELPLVSFVFNLRVAGVRGSPWRLHGGQSRCHNMEQYRSPLDSCAPHSPCMVAVSGHEVGGPASMGDIVVSWKISTAHMSGET